MTALYRPFRARRDELAAALRRGATTIDELGRLRARFGASPESLGGLRRLLALDPTLGARFAARILPAILALASRLLDGAEPALEIHRRGRSARTAIPRSEVAGWLAHLFLGTLPPPGADHPSLDCTLLLERTDGAEQAKLRCLIEYFDRLADGAPGGRLEIERIALPSRDRDGWARDPSPLTALCVDPEGAIEETVAHRQVDFANAYLGGGVLSGGCVQEEIRFAVAPELLVGMIVSPAMADHEAIVLRGAERFARTRGYGFALAFDGPFVDPAPRGADGAPDVELTAIDAADYRHRDPRQQLALPALLRELAKARAGFRRDDRRLPVATGNWGCGVFRGDPPLKAVLQWLAASAEGRAVRYCSFGDPRVGDLAGFAEAARQRLRTVGELWSRLELAVGDGGAGLYARLLSS